MTIQPAQPSPSQQIIAATLDANSGQLWHEAYIARSAVIIAGIARPMLQLLPYQLALGWERLDESAFREAQLQAAPIAREISEDLVDSPAFAGALNAALEAIPLSSTFALFWLMLEDRMSL